MHTHTTKGNKREYTVCRAPESSDRHSRQLLKTAAKKAAGSSSIFGAHGRAHMYIPNVYRCDSRRSTTPRPSKAKGAPLNPTPRPAPPRPPSLIPTNPPRSLPTIARVSSWHVLDTPPTPPTAPSLPPQASVLMRSGRGPRGRVLSTHPSLPSRASSSTRRQRPARGTLRGPLSLEAPPTSSRSRTRSAHRPLC